MKQTLIMAGIFMFLGLISAADRIGKLEKQVNDLSEYVTKVDQSCIKDPR